jgi:mRNA interferase YafQ
MRAIVPSTQFKRSLKRYRFNTEVLAELKTVTDLLAIDEPLPPKYHDHALHNNWEGCRDCHLRPNTVLIYRKTDDGLELLLLRIGSHSELFS